MKKFFIITLAVLFVAGATYAVEYDYSGMINTRGSYIANSDSTQEDAPKYMYYDMEFDSTLKIKPTDTSLIYLNWEIHDENWESTPGGSDDKTGDDQIAFKRAFGSYTFGNGGTLDFGLMTGGAWATAFGDNANGKYRLKYVHPTGFGPVFAILEKNYEAGNDSVPAGEDSDFDLESDDSDAYYLATVTKAGDIAIKPLLGYVQVGNQELDEETDTTITVFLLGADGSFGAIGFEAEFNYKAYKFDLESDPDDYNLMGAYANVWTSMDAFEVGAQLAYGSFDKDAQAGFGFGEDFCPGYWVCDWDAFGDTGLAEYNAATLAVVYGSYAVSDALSLNAAVEYMISNAEDNAWEGATGTIFNFGGSYKLADNVAYSFGFATGSYSIDEDNWEDFSSVNGEPGSDSPDNFTRAYHKIQINF